MSALLAMSALDPCRDTRSLGATHGTGAPIDRDREALFTELQPLVRRLIRQYGDTAELRQELPGEIYRRFCDLLGAYDPSRGIPLRPYLIRTLTASVHTWARTQWRNRRREVAFDTESYDLESAGADPTGDWDRGLMTGVVLQALPQAISALPPRQRQVVVWRYYESRSFDEIADDLEVRPATARSLLRHGLRNLRRTLERAGIEA